MTVYNVPKGFGAATVTAIAPGAIVVITGSSGRLAQFLVKTGTFSISGFSPVAAL